MGALVLEAPPLLVCIPPQHKPLAQQLHWVGDLGVQVFYKCQWIPLLGPVIHLLLNLTLNLRQTKR